MIEMLRLSLTRILLTLVVSTRITGQPRYGNYAANGKMDQRNGRNFIISIIVLLYILPSMILCRALTINQHSTGG